ncbi:MAG: hypothetical protein WC308_04520 [archaeon]|jgi:hypothetical protein
MLVREMDETQMHGVLRSDDTRRRVLGKGPDKRMEVLREVRRVEETNPSYPEKLVVMRVAALLGMTQDEVRRHMRTRRE